MQLNFNGGNNLQSNDNDRLYVILLNSVLENNTSKFANNYQTKKNLFSLTQSIDKP